MLLQFNTAAAFASSAAASHAEVAAAENNDSYVEIGSTVGNGKYIYIYRNESY